MKLIRETTIKGQRYAVVVPAASEFFCANCDFKDIRAARIGGSGCPYYAADRNDSQEGCSATIHQNKNHDVIFLKYETFLLKQLKGE